MTSREEGPPQGKMTAIKTLKKKGYRIIERNHRNWLGEIDVVAEEGGCLVFVEVKKRNSERSARRFAPLTSARSATS